MRKRIVHRVAAACAAASAAALLAGTGLAAQAATPGWRQVFSRHFGAAGNFPLFDVVVATSAKNAWTLGGTDVGGGTAGIPVAEHWNGKAWGGYALPACNSRGIQAFSATDVWASAVTFGNVPQAWLLHYNGRAWSKFRVPWSGMNPGWGHIVSDGHGGLWLDMLVSSASGVKYYEVHRTANGAWGRTVVGAGLTGLARTYQEPHPCGVRARSTDRPAARRSSGRTARSEADPGGTTPTPREHAQSATWSRTSAIARSPG
jgi:hypothetical protein